MPRFTLSLTPTAAALTLLLAPACAVDERVPDVRERLRDADVTPLPPAPAVTAAMFELGQALAFDKILSGNRDISCMTCHHPALHSEDDRPLSAGAGATGLGADRVHPDGVHVPRNAPALFNMHAFPTMFWDGRVELRRGRLVTPAGDQLTPDMEAVFDHGVVSAQAMFPVTSDVEMRGLPGETRSRTSTRATSRASGARSCGAWEPSRSTSPCSRPRTRESASNR